MLWDGRAVRCGRRSARSTRGSGPRSRSCCRPRGSGRLHKLRAVRLLHTIVWAFFAGAILAIPIAAWTRNLPAFVALVGIVLVEVLILAANRMRCPLTDVAARYTDDRRANFDIYLPLFLATYNKQIFGSLFVAGVAFGILRFLQQW